MGICTPSNTWFLGRTFQGEVHAQTCPMTLRELCKMTELIEMLFGLWTWVGPRKHVLDRGPDTHLRAIFREMPDRSKHGARKHVLHGGTMAPPGDYDWTIRVLRRHSLMSNYFDYFFSFISNTTPWTNLYDIVCAVPSIKVVCLQSVQTTYCKHLTTELLKSSETRQTKNESDRLYVASAVLYPQFKMQWCSDNPAETEVW